MNRLRAELRAATPASYRPWKHVGLIAAFVAAGLVATLSRIGGLGGSDWLWLAALCGLLNFGEYASHRWTLHRPVFPRAIYHRHVVEHHGFFSYDAMAVETWDDVRWVLFPWWALPLLLVTVLPIAGLLQLLVSARVGWLFLLAVTVYYGLYEILHALAHLPAEHRWAGLGWVRTMTHHHRVHHDSALMRRYNFNFVIPAFDWLLGTTYRVPR